MAKRSGLSKSTVGRIWRTFDVKPHRKVRSTLRPSTRVGPSLVGGGVEPEPEAVHLGPSPLRRSLPSPHDLYDELAAQNASVD